MASNSFEKSLRVFTLNCWGLRFVSEHKQQRIKLITEHLVQHNYDVVFLQEIWCKSDFDFIKSATKSRYSFAHMFRNASILGTSGLAVLTSWTPKLIYFHPFSVNGSPFRPLHGDWFTSKGVGYVKAEIDGLAIHLFCTHMHAQYDLKEQVSDQYSVHRICQSYELSKFINLMVNSRSDSNSRELVILAGDMNSSSKELPYRLLVSLTDLKDCYKCGTKDMLGRVNRLDSGDCISKDELHNDILESDLSDDDSFTCGHRDNTFTPPNPSTSGGKRIDFILFKLIDNTRTKNGFINKSFCQSCAHIETDLIDNEIFICKAEHFKIASKDDSGLSFSDHQPVVAELKVCSSPSMTTSMNDFEVSDPSNINGLNLMSGNKMDKLSGGGIHRLHDKMGIDRGDTSYDIIENSDKCEGIGLLTGRHTLKSNILLEVGDSVSKASKYGPLQLKQIASNVITGKSKSDTKVMDKNNLLENMKCLLEDYARDNKPTMASALCLFGLVVVFLALLVLTFLMLIPMTVIEVIFLTIIITIIIVFSALLRYLSVRHERNAVKAILNDLKKEILFKCQM